VNLGNPQRNHNPSHRAQKTLLQGGKKGMTKVVSKKKGKGHDSIPPREPQDSRLDRRGHGRMRLVGEKTAYRKKGCRSGNEGVKDNEVDRRGEGNAMNMNPQKIKSNFSAPGRGSEGSYFVGRYCRPSEKSEKARATSQTGWRLKVFLTNRENRGSIGDGKTKKGVY